MSYSVQEVPMNYKNVNSITYHQQYLFRFLIHIFSQKIYNLLTNLLLKKFNSFNIIIIYTYTQMNADRLKSYVGISNCFFFKEENSNLLYFIHKHILIISKRIY